MLFKFYMNVIAYRAIVAAVVSALHSAKGGAVETGCSDLYDMICRFTKQYYPHPLHPRSTAPSAEYPYSHIIEWGLLY